MFLILALMVGMGLLSARLERSQAECERYRHDVELLQTGMKEYTTKDSLNAAQVSQLELTIREYERYRADDSQLIRTLQMRNRDLNGVITAQSKMLAEVHGLAHDSLIYVSDTVQVMARCVDIDQPFLTLHGCMAGREFVGDLEVRDSILIVESVRYGRFLGFLWKTKKVKDRHWDIVSRNPDVTITGFDVVTIVR